MTAIPPVLTPNLGTWRPPRAHYHRTGADEARQLADRGRGARVRSTHRCTLRAISRNKCYGAPAAFHLPANRLDNEVRLIASIHETSCAVGPHRAKGAGLEQQLAAKQPAYRDPHGEHGVRR